MYKMTVKNIRKMLMGPKVTDRISFGRFRFDLHDDNTVLFYLDDVKIDWFHSVACIKNEKIDTRTAKRIRIDQKTAEDICQIEIEYRQDDLSMIQYFTIEKDKPYFTVRLSVSDDKQMTVTNRLIPLDFIYPQADCHPLFLSLDEKMLKVPYDNDMWVHYDTVPLSPGRTSYDVTAIYDERSCNGLLIGALDFDIWKNGIVCSAYDARSFMAVSGIADEGTHDLLPHASVSGKKVFSSRFICGFYSDIRDGLEEYGRLCHTSEGIFHWDHGVPFGWNSYSALTLTTRISHVRKAADFLYEELPSFRSEDGVTYINFDAVFFITKKEIRDLVKKLHSRGQKVGWYMNPLSHLSVQDEIPLRGNKKMHRKDIVLKDPDGNDYPPIDNKYPIDITIPEAEEDFRLALREFVKMDMDYLKIDFLSHGAVEGVRYDKTVKTGRQALMYFYRIVMEELDPEKIHKEIFLSSSIAPLFPCGYAHSRRASCDAFGHHEDTRYVLNALSCAWWTNQTLYQFSDPDHTVLNHSLVDGREMTSDTEARSRYNASVISGTVMLLSDNYGPGKKEIVDSARKRALKFADQAELNELARSNIAFRPLTLNSYNNVFYTKRHVALFNYEDKNNTYEIDPIEVGLPKEGVLLDLNRKVHIEYSDRIRITLDPYDSAILKLL